MPRKPIQVQYDCPTCGHAKNTATVVILATRPSLDLCDPEQMAIVHGRECGKPCFMAAADGEHYDAILEAVSDSLDQENGPHWRHDADWYPGKGSEGGNAGGDYSHIMREARKVK